MIARLFLLVALLAAVPASAQTFPALTGRVVDQAELLTPDQEAQLSQRLEALQRVSSRQLVVATIASLEDRPIEDYGYQLGRHWGIGQRGANNGVILIVAPNERKMRIEVGYGLEGIITDALASQIIRNQITPRFREGDMAGGIFAGADAIIAQLQAPPEAAEQAALAAQQAENRDSARRDDDGSSIVPIIVWIVVLLFILVPMIGAGFAGRRYRGRGRRRGRVSVWGPGTVGRRGDGDELGWMLAGMVLGSLGRGGRGGGSWGGGGGSWGGGGGGFSGGGGSFGGGGASGGW